MTIKKLIKENKEAGEDFEFYPSTKKMIQVVADDIKSSWKFPCPAELKDLDDIFFLLGPRDQIRCCSEKGCS